MDRSMGVIRAQANAEPQRPSAFRACGWLKGWASSGGRGISPGGPPQRQVFEQERGHHQRDDRGLPHESQGSKGIGYRETKGRMVGSHSLGGGRNLPEAGRAESQEDCLANQFLTAVGKNLVSLGQGLEFRPPLLAGHRKHEIAVSGQRHAGAADAAHHDSEIQPPLPEPG